MASIVDANTAKTSVLANLYLKKNKNSYTFNEINIVGRLQKHSFKLQKHSFKPLFIVING